MSSASQHGKLLRLLEGTGLIEVAVTEHATTYSVPDTETLWRGGLGSLVLTGAAIKQQDKAKRRPDPYRVRPLRQRLQISQWTEPAGRIQGRLRPAADLRFGSKRYCPLTGWSGPAAPASDKLRRGANCARCRQGSNRVGSAALHSPICRITSTVNRGTNSRQDDVFVT